MADKIERVISESGTFFGVACNTTELVTKACRRHDVGPLAAAALGRALTGAALLSALLKDGQSLMLKFEGNGPLKKILAEAGYDGWTRGYVAEPHAELPLIDGTLDIPGGIGRAGLLTVTRKSGDNKKYPGTIELYTSDIAKDIAYYLDQSEQTPSTLGLTVHLQRDGSIASSGGFLIQALPPAEENTLTSIEKRISALPPLSQLLGQGVEPAEILSQIFKDVPHRKIHEKELIYNCSCSIKKMESALLSLGAQDIQMLMKEKGGAEVRCEFCRKLYTFNRDDLARLSRMS
ncbi:MAG: Hsp33 family molecular chaperone HslO [Desulfobulbaceae bacterium]|nr:Hsp33 family molecular chaperone HslO [Desulfobulbaceae bacterium]